MSNLLSEKLILEYLPKNIEEKFSYEFLQNKMSIIKELETSNVLNQSYFIIKNIIIQLGVNLHKGHDTYYCRISIVSDSTDSDFSHIEESKDYLANIRNSVKAAIHFVRQKNQKNHEKVVNSDNNSF